MAMARWMADDVKEALEYGYRSMAVIGKTPLECEEWQDRLRQAGTTAPVITGKEAEYHGGLVIVPAYLAKGLEFDVVMIVDADQERYGENELDIKLLYMAMTRPLHRLHLYYRGELSPLLVGVEPSALQ